MDTTETISPRGRAAGQGELNELLTLPAMELARRIREREVSPVEVVRAHIERIEEVNPRINAVIVTTFDEARREAERAEAEVKARSASELPPLFGVPFTVKELISVKGLSFTAGVVARRGITGEEDAPLVARMRAAGGILVGLTNVAEAGLWLESHNPLFGRTNNAHSTQHIAGGSSGGEGAIIASGGSPVGLGADIGGSIRNPCFFNGIAGHKPTGGLLPSTGHWPPAEGRRGLYCVSGPMGRTVGDVAAVMEMLSPEEDPHRLSGHAAFRRIAGVSPRDVTVYHFTDNGLARVSDEIAGALEEAARALSKLGCRVEPWRPSDLHRSAEVWGAKLAETDDMGVKEILGNGRTISVLPEWLKMPFGRANHSFISLLMATFERVSKVSARRTDMLVQKAAAMQAEIEGKLGDRGVLLCPTYPRAAPKHDMPLLSPLAFSYCGVFNVLELPSTAVPTGRNAEGLPLGVQVAGRRFNDPLTLWAAERIEEAFGGFQPGPRVPR